VAGRTQRHLDVWGVTGRETREDLARDILLVVIEGVMSLAAEQEFWECRFWTCFDRRARTVLRDMRRGSAEVALDDRAETDPRLPAGAEISVEVRAVAAEALGSLPEPLRTAFILKHYAGYQEESGDPDEQTIARALGVTGRSVRNYLRRAERILAEWRDHYEQ
jgi:DNA-directed RNA polymerase specialized sigma24 family protein